MGCCVSTNTTSPPPKTPHISDHPTKHNGGSKSPPPTYPLSEEESVKEVLSETSAVARFHESERKHHGNGIALNKSFGNGELSEVESEICSSQSESVSVATAFSENNETNAGFREVQRRSPARYKNRSFSGEVKREKTTWRSPGRRSDPSPSRSSPGPGYGRRVDSGETSERRSRSPMVRSDHGSPKTALGGGKTLRKMDGSPSRVGFGSGERARKVEEAKEIRDNTWPPTSNELLENPLVSLECFIFL